MCVFNCTFLLGCCDIDFVCSVTLLTPRSVQRWLCASESSCGTIETERNIGDSDMNFLHIVEFFNTEKLDRLDCDIILLLLIRRDLEAIF